MMQNKDFVAFILTHGRPDNVVTYNTLRELGYTGEIVLVLDDEDKTRDAYIQRYGADSIELFNKADIAQHFDEGVKGDRRTIVYARNACFDIAKKLGYRYFAELDDDYTEFEWRFDNEINYIAGYKRCQNLDSVFDAMLNFLKETPIKSVAFGQGGDFIGGSNSQLARKLGLKRKAMNSFFCDTERRFWFIGRINEDVNTYTRNTSTGDIFFQVHQVILCQKQTQSNNGGMTDVYLDSGTYLKSFFSVIFQPSSVKVGLMGNINKRLHHSVRWINTAPRIIDERFKKYGK